MVQEASMKKLHSEEKKEPYNTLNRTGKEKKKREKKKKRTTKSISLLRTVSLGEKT